MNTKSVLPILIDGDTYRVTSPFGSRVDPITQKSGVPHNGVDLVLWRGYGALSAIGAAWDGIVSCVSYDASRGNYVIIDHGEGLTSHYFHMAQGTVCVALGENVAAGQVIGQMGSTGASTGAHLHFQLELNCVPIDPLPFIVGEELFVSDMPMGGDGFDNEPADWSAESVLWALDNGILYGDDNGNLMLHQPCTREQMVVFLHRLYKLMTEGQA